VNYFEATLFFMQFPGITHEDSAILQQSNLKDVAEENSAQVRLMLHFASFAN
jgi:hypothetical protein